MCSDAAALPLYSRFLKIGILISNSDSTYVVKADEALVLARMAHKARVESNNNI